MEGVFRIYRKGHTVFFFPSLLFYYVATYNDKGSYDARLEGYLILVLL